MRMWKNTVTAALAVGFMTALPAVQAFAQDGTAAEDAGDVTIGKVIQWGGIVGGVIIIISIAMVALVNWFRAAVRAAS